MLAPAATHAKFRSTPRSILIASALCIAPFVACSAGGGDIGGGAAYLSQMFLRPTASLYRMPLDGVFLCSSSTPPAPGVHGMCGYFAAEAALKRFA